MKTNIDVIIIGSGIGGLSAGAFLAQNGCRVKLFERLPKPGGYVHTFKKGGYTFEATTHQLCGFKTKHYLAETLALLNITDKLVITESNLSVEAVTFDEQRITKRFLIEAGYDRAKTSLNAMFSGQEKKIDNFFQEIKNTSKDLFRIKKIQRKPSLGSFVDMITALCLKKGKKGSLIQKIGIASYPYFVKYRDKVFSSFLSDIEDDALRYVLSQYCYYVGLPPEKVSAYIMAAVFESYIMNKPTIIQGGTGVLVQALVDKMTEYSAALHYNANVEEILVRNNRAVGVRLSNGKEHFAKFIISNGSAFDTFKSLINKQAIINETLLDKINHYKPSTSIFQVYLGLPFDLAQYGLKASTTIFSNRADTNIMFADHPIPSSRSTFLLTNYRKTNPEFNKGEKSSIVITEYDDINRWIALDEEKYKEQKAATEALILKKVQAITGIPFDKAEICFSGTPKTMAHYSGDRFGSLVGAELNVAQSSINRFSYKTPVPGLFLVGADSMPSGGVSACLDSGVIAGKQLLRS